METTAFCLSRYFYRLESQFCTLFYASSLISCSSCKSQASACVVLLKQYHSIWILHVWGTLLPVTEHIYRYTLIHEGNAGRGSLLWSVVARATSLQSLPTCMCILQALVMMNVEYCIVDRGYQCSGKWVDVHSQGRTISIEWFFLIKMLVPVIYEHFNQ